MLTIGECIEVIIIVASFHIGGIIYNDYKQREAFKKLKKYIDDGTIGDIRIE